MRRNRKAEARKLLSAVLPLLRGWLERAGEQIRGTLTRPEWLLDGWGQICGMWEAVARDERPLQRETLQQLRAALPMLDPNDREHRSQRRRATMSASTGGAGSGSTRTGAPDSR